MAEGLGVETESGMYCTTIGEPLHAGTVAVRVGMGLGSERWAGAGAGWARGAKQVAVMGAVDTLGVGIRQAVHAGLTQAKGRLPHHCACDTYWHWPTACRIMPTAHSVVL